MAGPKAGSVVTPIMSSRPSRRETMDWTRTPVIFASGRRRFTVAMMSSNWSPASLPLRTSRRTPFTSDLWVMSGDRILITTG